MLDQLQGAAVRDDRAAFDQTVSARDPGFAERASVWFDNLRTLGGQLQLRATSSEAIPGVGDRTRFADRAWLQQVITSWRPGGSIRAAEATIWLTVVPDDGRVLLAGDTDAPPTDRSAPRPVWLQTAVAVERRGPLTVIGSTGVRLDPWLDRAEAAAEAVRKRLADLPGTRWDGALAVEVPATRLSFQRSIGVTDGSYARIGAVAWPRGARPSSAAVLVVVNPEVAGGLSAEGQAVLLTHEVVHVATRSFGSAAPMWLVEGFADLIAYDSYPSLQAAARRPLRDAIRRGWLPTELPPEAAFEASATALDLAYAQAWSLCRLLANRYGEAALGRLYVSVGAGKPLGAGLRALGTSESALLRDWRTALRGSLGGPAGEPGPMTDR